MKILFLEDRASATEQIEDYLKIARSDSVFSAANVYEANKLIGENDIDCFVIDLNLPPYSPLQRKSSKLFTGWIWIIDFLIKEKFENRKNEDNFPIIIYSEFIDELEEQYKEKLELPKKKWEYLNKIFRIRKFEEGTTLKMMDAIETIRKQIK